MVKKLIVIILCVCMLVNFSAQPVHAMGAEGIIIGGAAAAGVTLTIGQVALIAAAGFGLIYAVTHADELGAMLESALSSAASNDESRLAQLMNWKTAALGGLIALTTAPAWIKGVIQNWAGELHENVIGGSSTISPSLVVSAGTPIPIALFWGDNPTTVTFDKDVTVLRAGRVVKGSEYWTLASYLVCFSTEYITGSNLYREVDGQYYYIYVSSTGLNPPSTNPLAGSNLAAYEAISALYDYDNLDDTGYTYSTLIRAFNTGLLSPSDDESICPDATVGGVGNALEEHSIDNINIPDINVGQSDLLVPDNTASINDTLNDVLTRLEQQELTWQQYMDDVAVGTPTVSVPAEGTDTGTLEYPLTDTGVSDVPIDTTQPGEPGTNIPEGIEPYTLDLRTFFPFCIPFDIVKFVDTLCAEPEAPCFTWGIATPDGGTEEIEVDLAVFDPVAEILRGMELLLFIIGLAFLTRALIRG